MCKEFEEKNDKLLFCFLNLVVKVVEVVKVVKVVKGR
jgi:hypothetical protein